ncbi:hypothetical protein A2865_02665 [Candidatus Woesebacteria bacterium RIFCSPHIGHO2_01_FULL_39_17]|uniref:Uncharacterized protein n=1 Tax=Candidatus Woesebacteria bacterium GW2011_GWA1_39_21b TaxID=1618551 RepID=A0A0G0NB47_9BACT|nr:MAG: hypothetical protein UT40_C0018G0034 [Candidatus Woesebacteria bacterium GW2011_GWA1_39_21b]OGM22493.1 MAG: hypothetical protein A2865_02665 [Candidatus Woesebacteria bacterium RIFCSPHIGHO2_01_FULL_39_17]
MERLKVTLRQKSNEILQGILVFLTNKDKEITFELFENNFPEIKGKRLGSLFSGIARTDINGKRIAVSIPQFGSRRKVWKLNKELTDKELEELEVLITNILEERR